MKNLSALLLSILLTSQILLGQLPVKQWDVIYGGMDEDQLRVVKQTSDGGYILAGFSRSGKTGNKTENKQGDLDYWIVKTNATGVNEFQKVYGGALDDELTTFLETSDGGFLIGGFSKSGIGGTKTQNSQGAFDFWLVRTDPGGVQLWDKTYGGNKNDKLISIQQTPDGGYIIGGYSLSEISGDKTQGSQGGNDYWILKIDASGIKQWDARFGGGGEDKLSSLITTADGGYLLGGTSNSEISGDKTQTKVGGDDYWIVKTDANGVKQWDKSFGGVDDDQLEKIIETENGGYLLAGSSASGISGDKTRETRGGFDYWVVKTDANGLKKWDAGFGGSADDYLRDAIKTSDGKYMLAGTSSSSMNGDKTQDRRDETSFRGDYWMIKINTAGLRQYDLRFGSGSIDDCFSIDQTLDGGFLLGGYTILSTPNADITDSGYDEEDYCIIKTDAGGTGKFVACPTITPLSYFPGDSILIPFIGNGTFSSNNTFTAQLSDANGDFSDPTDLSSITSNIFGSISTTLLSNTPFGSKYKVRVVSSEAPLNSFGNEDNISINYFKAICKQWDKAYGVPNGVPEGGDIIQTNDGGYLLGLSSAAGVEGDKTHASWGQNDYWIIKLDSAGNKLWDADFGGTKEDQLYAVLQTNDGGYLIGGGSYSGIGGNKTQGNKGQEDFWIVKTDANGAIQWDNTYGTQETEVLMDMQQTTDGGYILGGFSRTQGDILNYDYWVVKIGSNGNKLWDKRYGGTWDDVLFALQQTKDGGYILSGQSNSGAGGDKTQPSFGWEDYWLVKIDSTGIKQWDCAYGGWYHDYALCVLQTFDGGYLVGGYTESTGISGNKSSVIEGGSDYWVIKTDSLGQKQWENSLGGVNNETWSESTGGFATMPYGLASMVQTPDSGFVLAGSSSSGIGGDRTQLSQGENDYWIVKTNKDGSKLWDARFGGDGPDDLFEIKQTADGGFILAGNSSSTISGDKTEDKAASEWADDFWIVKTDDGLLPIPACETPSTTFASNIKTTSAKVNWNMVPGAQTYSVRYRKTGTTSWTKTTAQLNYKKLSPLSPNTQYDWAVKSVCEAGTLSSDWCATQNFTTKPLRLENDDEEISFGVFPNPVADAATILFTLTQDSPILLELLSVEGKLMMTIADENIEAGNQLIHLSRQRISSGIYLLRLTTAEGSRTEKLVFE